MSAQPWRQGVTRDHHHLRRLHWGATLSETWWHLAIYRFRTALGIGGEWAAGAAIVAETWPEEKRAKAAGVIQSA